MQHITPEEIERLIKEIRKGDEELSNVLQDFFESDYVLRVGRAFLHGLAAYLLLGLQPHFTFNFMAFSAAVFFLALTKRGILVSEAAILLAAISIFIPAGVF